MNGIIKLPDAQQGTERHAHASLSSSSIVLLYLQ